MHPPPPSGYWRNVMVTLCWAAKGGSGTTVVAAALALTSARHALLVDLDGELPAALGLPEPDRPGVVDWLSSDAPPDHLHDLAHRHRHRRHAAAVLRSSLHVRAGRAAHVRRSTDGAALVRVADRTVGPHATSSSTPVPGEPHPATGRVPPTTTCSSPDACYLSLRRAVQRLDHGRPGSSSWTSRAARSPRATSNAPSAHRSSPR